MTTPRTRSLVSRTAGLTFALMLGGCLGTPSHVARDASSPTEETPLTIRFDNEARESVHVYLVSAQREWLLGRVAPAARATLRIPDAALAGNPEPMWLAALTGERTTLRAAAEARAAITIAQPAVDILAQRWSFSQLVAKGQLTPLPLARSETGRH